MVLRDIWKDVVVCNGKEVFIVGGFWGFRNVFLGVYIIENYGVKFEVELEVGEVKVFVLDLSENVSVIYIDYCGIYFLMWGIVVCVFYL